MAEILCSVLLHCHVQADILELHFTSKYFNENCIHRKSFGGCTKSMYYAKDRASQKTLHHKISAIVDPLGEWIIDDSCTFSFT